MGISFAYLLSSVRDYYSSVVAAAITGLTPTAYINHIKINRAKHLLRSEPSLSITDISVRCGFENLAYFGKTFKSIVGESPSNYRDR